MAGAKRTMRRVVGNEVRVVAGPDIIVSYYRKTSVCASTLSEMGAIAGF